MRDKQKRPVDFWAGEPALFFVTEGTSAPSFWCATDARNLITDLTVNQLERNIADAESS